MSDPTFDPLSQLRELDPERYMACLYLSEEVRTAVATIYLFDAEISRIPDLISDPMPGEIRLQFWRDIIAGGNAEEAGPLAVALLSTISDHNLPAEVFHNYLNARIFDLYQDPMPNMGSFEGYLGETHSALLQMVALCAGFERSTKLADACGHAGVAYGISRSLTSTAWHSYNRRVYVPAEILRKNDLVADAWLDEKPDHRHLNVIAEMTDIAKSHKQKGKAAIDELPKETRSLFLPIAFIDPLLNAVKKHDLELLNSPVKLGAIQRQWAAFKWAMKWS